MLIENEFTVSAPQDELWAYLLDVEKIAPCMPGAELTETVDDRNWKGKLNAKFGPVALAFAGTVAMTERDDEAHRVVLTAKGMEQKGKGAANATVTSWLEAAADDRDHREDDGRHHPHRRRCADLPRAAAGDLQEAHATVRRLPGGQHPRATDSGRCSHARRGR